MSTSHESEVFPVRLDGARKTYRNGKEALRGLSLSITPGSVVGLLGPNGAGKSTTLKLLATILRPSAGRLLFGAGQEDYWAIAEAGRMRYKGAMGWVPERPILYNRLTAHEYLRFIGRLLEIPRDLLHQRIDEILGALELSAAADKYVGSYSFGMQRKVCLAACLLHDPQVLLLDEPTAGVDPQGVRDLKEMIRRWKAEGRGVLLSTHILEIAEQLCDQVAIIHHGETVFSGDIDELRRQLRAPENLTLEDLFLTLTRGANKREEDNGTEARTLR